MALKGKFFELIRISYHCKSVVLGTLLGKGRIEVLTDEEIENYKPAEFSFIKRSEYARLHFTHKYNWKRKNYFFWKVSQVSELNSYNPIYEVVRGCFVLFLRFRGRDSIPLTKLYESIYENGSLKIKRDWLNDLTPTAIMVLWFDSGKIVKPFNYAVIKMSKFDRPQLEILVEYFKSVWGIEFGIEELYSKRGRSRIQLYLETEKLEKFFSIFLPLIPAPELVYKVGIVYDDPILQQRWNSELLKTLPHFKEALIKQKMI